MEAWVISLDERPDRLAAFRERAAAAHLDVQELVVPRCTAARDGWGGSPESCGNAEAHLQILQAGTGQLLMLEDDAMLPPSLLGYIDQALRRMPPEWELCLLGAGRMIVQHHSAHHDVVPITRFERTQAYLVSERGRAPLAECARRANWHWDGLAGRRMCARGQVWGYCPTIAAQDPTMGSDIPDSTPPVRHYD